MTTPTTERATMLPCPFCGGREIFVEPDERGSGGQHVAPYHVGCVQCKAEQCEDDEEDARAAWNRRATSEADAIERALLARLGEQQPVAWLWQHEETCRTGFVDAWQVENGWQEANPRNKIIRPLYDRQVTTHGQPTRFAKTYCSQCGGEFGPGNAGFSSCLDHSARNTAAHPSPAPVGAQEREAFEAYFASSRRSRGKAKAAELLVRMPGGDYAQEHTQRHWWTWQQALAARSAAQGAVQVPAWVSVHDALPTAPEDDDVPVWTWDGVAVNEDNYGPIFEQPAGPAVGGWVNVGHGFIGDTMGRVTHWMPRPTPAAPAHAGERQGDSA